ncbi:MAG: rhodanese-like domain-containing protein [SAR202 cluster bacterium]|nr:rhodanese-like domain-containing protein [SAR202 cluster bacterium]
MPRNVQGEPYTRLTAEEAHAMVKKGGVHVVDVRRPDEYEAGHVKGAVWVPVDEIIPRFDELPTDGKLLFICAMGARSGLAAEYAAAMGADTARLFSVDEGTQAWIDKGYPSSKGRAK